MTGGTSANSPTDRQFAIMLVLTAFDLMAPERVNTPEPVTRAQGWLALRTLGVTGKELNDALRMMGREAEPRDATCRHHEARLPAPSYLEQETGGG